MLTIIIITSGCKKEIKFKDPSCQKEIKELQSINQQLQEAIKQMHTNIATINDNIDETNQHIENKQQRIDNKLGESYSNSFSNLKNRMFRLELFAENLFSEKEQIRESTKTDINNQRSLLKRTKDLIVKEVEDTTITDFSYKIMLIQTYIGLLNIIIGEVSLWN
jgi:chromosome segregation ATPase